MQSLASHGKHLTFRTSGSTGAPKRCTHAVADLMVEVDAWVALLAPIERIVGLVPAHHIYGTIFTALLPDRLGVDCVGSRFSGARDVSVGTPGTLVVIAEIREYGVRIGLDDFGTGYSSLSYLNRYLTDTIKIDKSLVTGLCTDDRTLAIVLLIIQLARTLHVDVVAEGVETEEQAPLLASMSCSHAQGYFYSRPVTVDATTKMMEGSMYMVGDAAVPAPAIAA